MHYLEKVELLLNYLQGIASSLSIWFHNLVQATISRTRNEQIFRIILATVACISIVNQIPNILTPGTNAC